MALKDPELVYQMKHLITLQQADIDKKNTLLKVIQSNITYMTTLHQQNQHELDQTRSMNQQLLSENQGLKASHTLIKNELDKHKKDSEALLKEQQKIAKLLSDQENTQVALESMHMAIQKKNDKVQQLDFDLTVMFTEKQAFKKELDSQDQQIRQLQKDLTELKLKFDLLFDDNAKNLRQNADYKNLILGNENKMKMYREDLKDLQKKIDIREKHIVKLKDENDQFKEQIRLIGEQFKEMKDEKHHLIEENWKLMMGGGLIISDEQMKLKLQTLTNEMEFKRQEWEVNEQRLHSQLNFSKESNENLKKDYDLLQEKFENYMRTNDHINQTLREEIAEIKKNSQRVTLLYEELKGGMDTKINEATSLVQETEAKTKSQLKEKDKELSQVNNELTELKGEINIRLTKLKLMELDLKKERDKAAELEEFRVSVMSQKTLQQNQFTQQSQLTQYSQQDQDGTPIELNQKVKANQNKPT